jgi:hydroxymethylbilane synthase
VNFLGWNHGGTKPVPTIKAKGNEAMDSAVGRTIVIGSRGSELALWQANAVKTQLQEIYPDLAVEILIIKTKGDKIIDSSFSKIGSKGIFTREIENALLDGRIDLAVHSLKDLPTQLPDGLAIAAILEREDVRDVFVSHPQKNHRGLQELPKGAKIATGSLRRKCQLLHYRPDFEIVDIRGNVPTRLQKLDASQWDGMVLAKAGLARLNLLDRIAETVTTDIILPAVGQGAMAIEARVNDRRFLELAAQLHHEPTAIATSAERNLLSHLEGGCQVPIGAYARIERGEFTMDAFIGSLDGKKIIRSAIHGAPSGAEKLSATLAKTLLLSGGGKILKEIRPLALSEIPVS